jgi:hypothetical protein
LILISTWAVLLCGVVPASTPLRGGASLSAMTFTDLEDRPVPLASYRGKVLVLIHEDRHSGDSNRELKDRLGLMWERHRDDLVLIALAEVRGYNFWPARHYVKQALSKIRDLGGALVLCDWEGALRKRFGLRQKESALFLVGRDGRVLHARQGELSAAEGESLLRSIEGLLYR